MTNTVLGRIFEDFVSRGSVFADKKILQPIFMPEEILHRDSEVEQIANILAPILKNEKPSNLFLYGKTGTGKTLTTRHVISELQKAAGNQKQQNPMRVVYTNCKLKRTADTEYRLLAHILDGFGQHVPATGLPTEELYNQLYSMLERNNGMTLLVLDEIDSLVKRNGDGILYNLTRAHETTNSSISILGISNDVRFVESLDPRVKSTLSEEEVVFSPYNALQIQDILKARAKHAFKEGVLDPGVVEKCAAYAAREHGDARRALELLRVAGELADRKNAERVTLWDIDEAEKKIDRDRIYDVVITQPKQYNLVLYSILCLDKQHNQKIFTGDVYSFYKGLCNSQGLRALTQRRISDIIVEFDMLGIVNATTISKGRYGRTRLISIGLGGDTLASIEKFIKKEMGLANG